MLLLQTPPPPPLPLATDSNPPSPTESTSPDPNPLPPPMLTATNANKSQPPPHSQQQHAKKHNSQKQQHQLQPPLNSNNKTTCPCCRSTTQLPNDNSNTFPTTQNNHHLLQLGGDGNANDLVLSALRHQRDLFSGPSLGIPDVTTRVGSVIHAFETMARQRQALERSASEKPYDSTVGPRYRSHRSSNVKRVNDSRHKIILPTPKVSLSSFDPSILANTPATVQQSYTQSSDPLEDPSANNQNHHNNNIISIGGTHENSSSSNILHINNNNLGQYFLPSNNHNNHSHTIPRSSFQSPIGGPETHYNLPNENDSSNFDSLNLDDDYRKSSFGKQSKLQPPTSTTGTFGRNQHVNDGATTGTSTNYPNPSNSNGNFSRNNPNVFFNATPPLSQPQQQQLPEKEVPVDRKQTSSPVAAMPQGTQTHTMRYYNNHDNKNNNNNNNSSSSNRRPRPTSSTGIATLLLGSGNLATDDNDADNNNDKFLRGTTVSQSFIKNVKNMRRKSSSYDLQSANAAALGSGIGAGNGNSSAANSGLKRSGAALMTTAARHLYRRAIQQKGSHGGAGSDNDTDELTASSINNNNNHQAKPARDVDRSQQRGSTGTGTGKRSTKTFLPRTLDRAEI
ncbi:putative uncharacterized protein DDB_G0282133 [Uranotaenia lowii]|uniref:putative uncharacterized protein DDB_G0282133 n=1 Tax=Uranotaenia lowii TaxID=190385 RepID=UPI002478BD37|nr:putative uncharacterized protein DDB_G0282133 [Uranotaenia lowii]